ncbi:hypothetical protein AALB_0062 [Agarivorans albus MKT 106]|uniref:Uncharacterized protein n=1 Tax=Agarivorans albus MKT 106 TaxID=1331007 RepID=R9PF55_AGAAL|nr:hypothetical protein AALB_0062 [Agarivorans albus MKT 106]
MAFRVDFAPIYGLFIQGSGSNVYLACTGLAALKAIFSRTKSNRERQKPQVKQFGNLA